ncbi:MAG TPA: Rid family hydrolase [Thermoanaerobaculia bacterium]|nr:Rid family hydrolase [Thermoanaerobaculia bacterium]
MSITALTTLTPRYASAAALPSPLLGTTTIPAPQFGPEELVEAWPARQEPRRGEHRGIAFAEDGELLFASVEGVEDRPLEVLTREIYEAAIELVRAHGFPYFLRMWNHVGDINSVEGYERYQRFCVGRYEAFEAAGYHLDTDLPAASAVGMRGHGLKMHFIAARTAGEQVENPRQVSAYHYPRQYGPKSPSFSRATVWNDVVFVSGTSSVVGHETVHAGDVDKQLDETLRNIDVVLGRSGFTNVVAAKTYVRHEHDVERVARRLESVYPQNHLLVQADICRKDLLLEIEVVAR